MTGITKNIKPLQKQRLKHAAFFLVTRVINIAINGEEAEEEAGNLSIA
jgi:hypothetical protein